MLRNPFSRKRTNEDITKEIQNLLKDKPTDHKLAVLSFVMSEVARSDIESQDTKVVLDTSILEILKRVYVPKGALIHLSLITHRLVQENPNLISMLATATPQNIDNGVV